MTTITKQQQLNGILTRLQCYTLEESGRVFKLEQEVEQAIEQQIKHRDNAVKEIETLFNDDNIERTQEVTIKHHTPPTSQE